MPDPKRYAGFSVADFVSDEYFQNWVLRPNEESIRFWNAWLTANPARRSDVTQASALLSRVRFRNDLPANGRAEMSLRHALQKIEAAESSGLRNRLFPERARLVWRIAAAWIVVVAGAFYLYHISQVPTSTVVSTNYGETDTLSLPDQSQVVLNGNSTLRYTFKKYAPREVWLDGEAFFDVRHLDRDSVILPGERFLVHVGRGTVEVLGTTFNIRRRRSLIEIALISGSIRLHIDHSENPDVLLGPGELLISDTAFTNIKRAYTNTSNNAAWTEKRLLLNNPTVSEIVAYLEDTYGKKIVLASPALAGRKVEGPILLDSLDDALFVLSTVLNVGIVTVNDTLIIKQR